MKKRFAIGQIVYVTILFVVFIHCDETPDSPPIYNGLWKNIAVDDSNALDNDWIPSEYHIKEDDNKNGSIVYRVRILDPIACTDSYAPLTEDSIRFSQYNFNFVIRFDSDSTASVEISRADSRVTHQLFKSNEETYWGGCL